MKSLKEYIELDEGVKKGRTHDFILTKKKGGEALKKAEMDHIRKSLNLEIDREIGLTPGYTETKGRRIFNIYKDKDQGVIRIFTNSEIRDGDMMSLINKKLSKLGYENLYKKNNSDVTLAKVKSKEEKKQMKESFRDYVELKEERKYAEEVLNEDPLLIAGAVLGYALSGLAVGWGGALIVQGYMNLASKMVNGVRRTFKRYFKKDKTPKEIVDKVKDLKVDTKVKIQQNKQNEESKKYAEEFKDTFAAIKDKDADKAKEALKSVKLDGKIINRMVILETTKTFGEPPLHYGNTGNEAYLFIKKVLGIRVAQAASAVVKKAFETAGMDLVKDMDESVEINEGKKLRRSLAIVGVLTLLGFGATKSKTDWKEPLSQNEIQYVEDNKKYFEDMKSQVLKTGVGGEELKRVLRKSVELKMKRDGIISK
jgi:hypothetical protein